MDQVELVLTKQFQELERVSADPDIMEVEDERTKSWQFPCNSCHKDIWWNHCVRHRKTRKCCPMDTEFIPNTGMIPRRHKCMSKGRGYWQNKYEKKEIPKSVDNSNFYKDCVVREKENNITKDAKIDRWMKLTNYPGIDKEKTLANLLLAKQWREYTFEY